MCCSLSVTPPSIAYGFCGMGQVLFFEPTIKAQAAIAGWYLFESSCECISVQAKGTDEQPWMTCIKQQ